MSEFKMMKKALLIKKGEFEVINDEKPRLKENHVLVKSKIVGVCGSDLHVFLGSHPRISAPAVLGHECLGEVAESSPDSIFKPGDRVALYPIVSCGKCAYCKVGEENLCIEREVIGFKFSGGLAEYLKLHEKNLIKIPKNFDFSVGVLYEPLAVIIHAVSLIEIKKGQPVIITGAGTIGLLTATYLREELGVNPYLIEKNEDRITFAKTLGFQVYNSIHDAERNNNELLRPLVFECTGYYPLLKSLLTLNVVPKKVVILSTFQKDDAIYINEFGKYEISVVSSQMYKKEEVIDAITILSTEKREKYRPLIVDEKYYLENVQQAYERSLNTTNGVKVIIEIDKVIEGRAR
ncbi:alcohol dehydrogenase catalytic domain-containing protein [Sporosarcina sp. Marseille-Q4063]|uniref:zinc-dependent alcohol dehydrogenase n=1 Tax=Sporosarcina sp. Marseille-Q4063 TaxID=2810514 RepID=UPI001BAE9A21|nr:alcohol dehydrogenase catalytic domain-containing protein [Sporosarcina sp. Marseille-Q4063]QUW21266.1 alcohol dehydrogenase catalytic domain-containing protein [Sporosarcina sp. Marseille-Q4063]